ncbi:hypothetical protein M378DRAFT_15604 [Amanita muscaria Koide BX008]|uniref:Uncharacterized protein n=1 Tax=Amanita muscaria (strain Koide BX008) TaxID=946122 RepID=A0A0C2WAR6_AMAMK|nr:hypothetical protein M378DRAFT_15604 [Amanita muscaria Koide BX008]
MAELTGMDFIVDAVDKTPHLPRKDVETQFEQLVAHPTKGIACQIPQLAPNVIIDGVDECANEQLQWRFLSQARGLIEEIFDHFKDCTFRIDLATLDDANRDIEKYLVDQFSDIASKQGLDPSWPGREIIDEIVFKSSGNFILASTLR